MIEGLLRWPDLIAIGVSFVVLIAIGVICSRRNKSVETYFLAGRSMPGWVVGISLMATIISSMTFLATPGFTFKENWRYMPTHFTYLIAMLAALFLFMPFFRRGHVSSAYEYLERRFGTWARLYAAAGFIAFQFFRMGIILYAVCLPIQAMTGFPMYLIILVFGIIVAFYTIVGGLEAVIWTDVIQGSTLIIGGLICLPIILMRLPGGMGQIIEVGNADGKFGIGSTAFSLSEKTVWVMMLTHIFHYTQLMCTDQTVVQRYCAMRSDKEAKNGVILGTLLTIPVWVYFTFIGTALYVFYKAFPKPELNDMVAEQILPFFILTEVPAGIAGLILAGLFSAAMSTLDSSINASAATITTDFYRRIFVKNRTEQHYLNVGRLVSLLFAVIMISLAILIHLTRTTTLVDLQQTFIAIVSGGLLGLFLLGFLTKKVDNVSAIVATVCTVLGVGVWMVLNSEWAGTHFPQLSKSVPDVFWVNVVANTVLFCLGYFITLLFRRISKKNLKNLTIWTLKE